MALLDLDGTLINSEKGREAAWKRALAQLDGLTPRDPKIRLRAYRAVYKCYAEIKGKRGPRGHVFEDFRQEWNTRSSYAVLIAWCKIIGDFPLRDEEYYVTELKSLVLLDAGSGSKLLAEAETIRDPWSIEYSVPIERAVSAFWADDWKAYLYPGVRELLRSLDKAGIKYCVATEGHVPTQWQKICRVGLNDPDPVLKRPLVTQEQLLATSQAAQPRGEVDAMDSLIRWYHGRASACNEAAARIRDMSNMDDQQRLLLEDAKAADLVANGVSRIAGLFQRLAEKLHDEGGTKYPFYARTLYAINQDVDRPRDQFLTFRLNWKRTVKIRLAMVGDNYRSDIHPVVEYCGVAHAKIMSVWLRKQGHGAEEPDQIPKQWLECDDIAEAGKTKLLNADIWRSNTEPLGRPAGLFGSAVDPDETDANAVQSLQSNLDGLIAGIGAVWGDRYKNSAVTPEPDIVKTLVTLMDEEWFGIIVADIRSGRFHARVRQMLANCCFDPLLQKQPLFSCQGANYAALKLLLSLTATEDGAITDRQLLTDLAGLLDKSDARWAAAVVYLLECRSRIEEEIGSAGLIDLYCQQLSQLCHAATARELPVWFPDGRLFHLLGRLPCRRGGNATPPPHPPTPAPGDHLGYASSHPNLRQSVRLGQSNAGREVWCNVGGPEARNIICVCGEPGIGKFSTLTRLAHGCLTGEGASAAKPPCSSVIVFNIDPSGADRLVDFGVKAGFDVEVVVLPNELTATSQRLQGQPAKVNPFQFRLGQLGDEVILRSLGFEGKAPPELTRILKRVRDPQTHDINLDDLINHISRAQFRNKRHVQAALEDLRPFVSNQSFFDGLKGGKLTIVDCGRVSQVSKEEVLRCWNTILAVLSESKRTRKPDEQYLLVFDELAQVFGKDWSLEEKRLDQSLALIASQGRHFHTSLLGISQTAQDLLQIKAFSEHATVLLFHKLRIFPPSVPSRPLWNLAARCSATFPDLVAGEVWYASTENGETAGRVHIPRPPGHA